MHVRFGWFNKQHFAIDKQAAQNLPEGAMQQFVNQEDHLSTIQMANGLTDTVYFKPPSHPHYVSVEDYIDPALKLPVANPDDQPGAEAFAWFSPERKAQFAKYFAENDLPTDEMGKKPTLVQAIQHSYTQALAIMQEVKSGFARLNREVGNNEPLKQKMKAQMKQQLLTHLGQLNHYVGDLFMPFHVTNHQAWGVAPDDKPTEGQPKGRFDFFKSMHFFTEGPAFDRGLEGGQEFSIPRANVKAGYSDEPLELTNQKDLGQWIGQHLKNSYMKLFDIAAIHKKHQEALNSHGDMERFKADLADECREKVMIPQLRGAHRAVTELLQSLWVEAGQPDLASFDTKAPATQTDEKAKPRELATA